MSKNNEKSNKEPIIKKDKVSGLCYPYYPSALYHYFHKKMDEEKINEYKLRRDLAGFAGIPEETTKNHLRSEYSNPNEEPKAKRKIPRDVKTIMSYGEFLCGDKFAFFRPVPKENVKILSETEMKIFLAIFDELKRYKESGDFNFASPSDERSLFEKLGNLFYEIDEYVKSYSIPGVCERWRKLHKPINYFDCVFEIIDCFNNSHGNIRGRGIEKAMQLKAIGALKYVPNDEDIVEREKYFCSHNDDEELLFQKELIETVKVVFRNDFPD